MRGPFKYGLPSCLYLPGGVDVTLMCLWGLGGPVVHRFKGPSIHFSVVSNILVFIQKFPTNCVSELHKHLNVFNRKMFALVLVVQMVRRADITLRMTKRKSCLNNWYFIYWLFWFFQSRRTKNVIWLIWNFPAN